MEGMWLNPYLDDKAGNKKKIRRKIVIKNEQVKGIKLRIYTLSNVKMSKSWLLKGVIFLV